MKRPAYVLVVSNASENVLNGVEDVYKTKAFPNLRALVLTPDPEQEALQANRTVPIEVIPCSFETPKEIKAALAPFMQDIRAVVCGGEKHIQNLRKIVPHLPPSVLAATPRALEIATDKRLMREAFMRYAPEITPKFVRVYDATPSTVKVVEEAIDYPVIIKPTNLASSLLVQACFSRSELKAALAKTFTKINDVYKREGRRTAPQVIVEEYLEGDFYSIDAYAMGTGEYFYCPPASYIPAKQLHIDDFFLYKRLIPTELTNEQVQEANQTVAKALRAIGLTHSSAHVELVLTKQGWKVIELGPRVGRFRQLMYKTAYGFNHYRNDVLIHLGQKPHISDKLLQYCAGYLIYPEKEGKLREITGLSELEADPGTKLLRVLASPGERCLFAKHGGRATAEFVIAYKQAKAFNKAVAFIEKNVKAVVE